MDSDAVDCPPLHIVAPSFDPATVGGAGVVLVELTRQFLRLLPDVRIYLNPGSAKLFPEWKSAMIAVPAGDLRGGARPTAAALMRLEFLGAGGALPRIGVSGSNGVSWFPFGFLTPAWHRGPAVATIHDTLERDLPDAVPLADRMFRRFILPRTGRRARVATDSQFSRRQLQRHYGIEATVIPLAPVPLPPPSTAKVPGGSRPFVFYPANAWPHKNHRFLLETWLSSAELRERFALVYTLGGGLGTLAPEIATAQAAGAEIHVTGRLSAAELAGCYEAAECLAFPSLYEGFGLPVHEALACGCPALVSDRGSLPEVVPSDYPFVLPLEPAAWARALLAKPRNAAADFRMFLPTTTWEECARHYVELFRLAAATASP